MDEFRCRIFELARSRGWTETEATFFVFNYTIIELSSRIFLWKRSIIVNFLFSINTIFSRAHFWLGKGLKWKYKLYNFRSSIVKARRDLLFLDKNNHFLCKNKKKQFRAMIAWTKFGKWKKEAVQWMGGGRLVVRAPFPRATLFTGAREEKKNEKRNGEEWTGQALDVEL